MSNLFLIILNSLDLWVTPLETILLQLAIISSLLLLIFITNTYYVILFFFTFTFLLGIYLGLFQVELFTGFLYVIELTVVFIFIMIMFYLNFKGVSKFSSFNFKNIMVVFLVFPIFIVHLYSEVEFFLPIELNVIEF